MITNAAGLIEYMKDTPMSFYHVFKDGLEKSPAFSEKDREGLLARILEFNKAEFNTIGHGSNRISATACHLLTSDKKEKNGPVWKAVLAFPIQNSDLFIIPDAISVITIVRSEKDKAMLNGSVMELAAAEHADRIQSLSWQGERSRLTRVK